MKPLIKAGIVGLSTLFACNSAFALGDPIKTAIDATFAPHAMPTLDGKIEGFNVDMANLIGDVAAALRVSDPNMPLSEQRVLVRGDKDINYADFIAVINQLQQNGYIKIGLINEDIA